MRNTQGMCIDQKRYQAAMRKGNLAMMLHWHKKLTAKYINAEWETKQDLLSTVDQLEVHCDALERSNNMLGWFVVGAFVLGTCYGQGVVDMAVCGYDYLYNWLCI